MGFCCKSRHSLRNLNGEKYFSMKINRRSSSYRFVNVEFDDELADIDHECNFEKRRQQSADRLFPIGWFRNLMEAKVFLHGGRISVHWYHGIIFEEFFGSFNENLFSFKCVRSSSIPNSKLNDGKISKIIVDFLPH